MNCWARMASRHFSGNHLLRCLMEVAVIADVELERLLTALRFALLEMASAADASSAGMSTR